MPRSFTFPAQYTTVVESALALIGADIGRDVKMRAGEDDPAWVEKMAVIPTDQIDAGLQGRIVVVIVPAEGPDDRLPLPDHLHAFATTPTR